MRLLHPIPLGWLQLWHRKLRFVVALFGIGFAVMLILMQLGLRASMFDSAVRLHKAFVYDVAIFSSESPYIVRPESFSSRRLYQALAVDGVQSVTPVFLAQVTWKNPANYEYRNVYTIGLDPDDAPLAASGVPEQMDVIRLQDVVLYDTASRPEQGPIAERFRHDGTVTVEANARTIHVGGLFTLGTSFGIDASIVTSEDNFLRLFPTRPRTQINLGLVRVAPGVDPERARDEIRTLVPEDVLVMTRPDFVARETAYWHEATPIGFVFAFGSIIGFVVGTVIVYQILFSDVSDHLAEYATLRALGYSSGYVSRVVVQQALILAVLGYALGTLATIRLYAIARAATHLPIELSTERAVGVLATTIVMCAISGILALRKVRKLDPAEVF
jgi:putative ABC transport system permease protein